MTAKIDFMIIGAQKSASTLCHRCLLEHPQVFMPREEMPNFETPNYENDGVAALDRRMASAFKGAVVGLKRPDYLAHPECPERIKSHSPDSKLIVLLRNPASRAISAYYHLMLYGFIPLEDVNTGLPKILNGNLNSAYPKGVEIVEYGYYAKHIKNYLSYFDKSQLLIMLDGDLFSSPQEAVSDIYRFVGVDDSFQPKSLQKRENEGIYSINRLRFINLRNFARFDYSSDFMNLSLRRDLLALFVNSLIVGIDRLFMTRIYGKDKPKVDPSLMSRLREIYTNDIRELESMINRDLSHWLH